jgi:2'-5' RNA ligase
LAANRLKQTRMLEELTKVHRTGKDPHGNKLDPKQLAQVNKLITALRIQTHPQNNRGVGRTKEIAAKEVHTGVMVAFYIDVFSPDAAVKLQVPGGETWDALHLTLAYLGDSAELGPGAEGQLYQLVSEFARSSSPLEGMVSGVGLFNNIEEGESNAFVALFDSPALPDFRTRLMVMLQANGIAPVQNHGFTPHITLQYVPKGQPLPQIELPQVPMIFTKVTVKWGDKRTDFSLGLVEKEVKSEIAAKAAAHKPFTVFKDAKGQYRWVGVSSSSARDGDGETITQKALADDVARKDITGNYGPLNWWHTSLELGKCDFNAMDGPLLVESGTFKNAQIALAVEKAIAGGAFKPAMSLEFKHDQPARKQFPIPGLIFKTISREGRALLPAEIASNPLTRFQVYNSLSAPAAKAKKEVEKSMLTDEEKRKKALDLFGPEFLSALENDNEAAVKMAQSMNTVFKAMTPPPPPASDPAKKKDDPAGATDPAAVVVDKADPAAPVAPALAAADLGSDPEGMGEGGEGEGGFEDSPADDEADAIMQGLYDQIAKIFLSNNQALAATALTKVSGENVALKEKVAALETRLGALDGTLPPAVRARASQQGGVPAEPVTCGNPKYGQFRKAGRRPVRADGREPSQRYAGLG